MNQRPWTNPHVVGRMVTDANEVPGVNELIWGPVISSLCKEIDWLKRQLKEKEQTRCS